MKKKPALADSEGYQLVELADGAMTSRDPGQWPMMLQQAWAMRQEPSAGSPACLTTQSVDPAPILRMANGEPSTCSS